MWYLPAWNDNHRKLNRVLDAEMSLGIYLLEMTTTENLQIKMTKKIKGIYLLEMTTTENFLHDPLVIVDGIYLLEMTTTENWCIVILF